MVLDKRCGPRNSERVAAMVKCYYTHRKLQTVADQFNLTRQAVHHALKKAGVNTARIARIKKPAPPKLSNAARFWSKVDIGEPDACWLWNRPGNFGGQHYYGAASVNGKSCGSHRAAWIYTYGAIPKELWVLHKCGVSLCCNPRHLKLGTPTENCLDRANHAIARGTTWLAHRRPSRERRRSSRMDDVRSKCADLRKDGQTGKYIAELLGISIRTVYRYTQNNA